MNFACTYQKRDSITGFLDEINALALEIKENKAAVDAEIRSAMLAALKQNEHLARHKLAILRSEGSELVRQMHQLQWIDDFLVHQRDTQV